MNFTNQRLATSAEMQLEVVHFMSRVYAWMTFGILLTGAVAYEVAQSPAVLQVVLGNSWAYIGLILLQLFSVVFLMSMVRRISATSATFLYAGYAALMGVTLSIIFLVYTKQSISEVFAITSFAFAGLSGFGLVTKRDLGPVGSFCTMGLFGLIGFSLISMFFPSFLGSAFDQTMSLCGVIIFAGLTAYDTQKIKSLYVMGQEGSDDDRKGAIIGALVLYLDFVNLFLQLLRLVGGRRR